MNEQMVAALKAVELSQPINQAACDHGIPKTLKDRLSGRVVHGVQLGPKPHLSSAEEKLADYLRRCVQV